MTITRANTLSGRNEKEITKFFCSLLENMKDVNGKAKLDDTNYTLKVSKYVVCHYFSDVMVFQGKFLNTTK